MTKLVNSLVLCGGGIDSYVSAWHNQQQHPDERTILLYVDYGAKAREQELSAVKWLADLMNAQFGNDTVTIRVVGLDFWTKHLNSPLTSYDIPITRNPTGSLANEWVPARNTVLMSLALAMADDIRLARIVCGINQTAAVAYPDNSILWLESFRELAKYAVNCGGAIELVAPVSHLEKYQIVNLAHTIGMTQSDLEHSWSCYDNSYLHCGCCSSCKARKKAFRDSVWFDPTEYERTMR